MIPAGMQASYQIESKIGVLSTLSEVDLHDMCTSSGPTSHQLPGGALW